MQEMKAYFQCGEGADECSAVGCACVPTRKPVNGTYCTHSLRQTTHGDGVGWRVVSLKTRRGRGRDPGFSAGRSPFLCSSHICDVLILYLTTHASAPGRGFWLLLPLSIVCFKRDNS
ncbi:hypothetical protein Y032_0611g638 [Ancylostoma ceylanicum]|uniref:Uncharacterized protein n=1 Tax=Ancylostoma ceylanicum TaxID=53326 RepID=A0A016WLJ9_9BILA|nr:hypothetical protein Y032_0611g638 [Ancylostoma ceylanicum]